jgi:Mrp family chromosome partitioning ATPase/capsular polysaccharide biosynthesis protein
MTRETTDGLSLRAYLRVVARWKWLVIAVTVLITILGTAYTWTRTPMYAATAQLIYVKPLDIANPLGQTYLDTTAQQAEIESVPTVIASSEVHQTAQKNMKQSSLNAGYGVNAILTPGVNNDYSNVVSIEGISPSAAAAADAANAYAEAFISWGRDNARSQVADAIAVVRSQLNSFSDTQKQSSQYKSLQQTLAQLQLLQASVNGNFQIISPATEPPAPYSPDKKRGAALAFAGGLVVALALAFLVEQFDTRVRGDEQVSELLALPVIGHVPPVVRKGREKSVLPTLSDPSGPSAEAYRVLRSNLDFMAVDEEIKTLLVSSSLQGEGKSVATCNLAVSMALAGKRVILVDADLRSPRVHAYIGVPNAVGISSVVARRVEIEEALVPVALRGGPRQNGALVMSAPSGVIVREGGAAASAAGSAAGHAKGAPGRSGEWLWPDASDEEPFLRVLPSGPLPPNPGEIVASHRFGEIIAELGPMADIVLVDAPAMLPVGDAAAVAPWVDAMVYVVNQTIVRRPALHQARAQLAHLPCRKLGLIAVIEQRGHGYYSGYYAHAGEPHRNGRRARS